MTQQAALTILKTGASVFVTGEPGSGKTHTINEYIRYLKAAKVKLAVTASTGIAATHIGGVTVHAWSGIGIKKQLSRYDIDRIATNERLAGRIARTRVLIIDEVSMLDGRILVSVDQVCREVKRSREPFGGMQVVLVGDFFQLPPVVAEGEETAQFAFDSPAWHQLKPLVCYLSEQHRQADAVFLEILAALRANAVTAQHRAHLDSRRVELTTQPSSRVTQLFSHNVDVDEINNAELANIPGKPMLFTMKASGKPALVAQLKRSCLSPELLALKVGAAVMFTKNSPTGAFVNGTLGTVVGWQPSTKCPVVSTASGRRIQTAPMEWLIEDNGRKLAHIAQIPLRLAWAMTVHKSQGMSLDAAYVDLRQAFVAGQGYVALSRVRSLTGLFLAGYNQQALTVHPAVVARDNAFRQQSLDTAAVFGKLSLPELQTMQHSFIRAMGGVVPSAKQPPVPPGVKPQPAYSVAAIRTQHAQAYRRWDMQEDAVLAEYFRAGEKVTTIAQRLGRKPGAIRSRLKKKGMLLK